jgi:hypothetical protein
VLVGHQHRHVAGDLADVTFLAGARQVIDAARELRDGVHCQRARMPASVGVKAEAERRELGLREGLCSLHLCIVAVHCSLSGLVAMCNHATTTMGCRPLASLLSTSLPIPPDDASIPTSIAL